MNRRYLILLFSFVFIFIVSCDEQNDVIYEGNALLKWTGDFDNGGCGFFIEIDSINYKPENEGIISKYYKYKASEPLSVTVQYIDLMYEIDINCEELPDVKKVEAIKLTYLDEN